MLTHASSRHQSSLQFGQGFQLRYPLQLGENPGKPKPDDPSCQKQQQVDEIHRNSIIPWGQGIVKRNRVAFRLRGEPKGAPAAAGRGQRLYLPLLKEGGDCCLSGLARPALWGWPI